MLPKMIPFTHAQTAQQPGTNFLDLKKMKRLFEFLQARPAIAIRSLENETGMPKNTLANAIKGHSVLPEKWIWPLCTVLQRYGLELDGWIITVDEEAPVFFGRCFTEPYEQTEKEIKHDVGISFEYWIKHQKTIWDLADFVQFLQGANI
jgi:hypothetical protein